MNDRSENQLDMLVDEIKYDYTNNTTLDKLFLIFSLASLVANFIGSVSNIILFGFSFTTIVCIIFVAIVLGSLLITLLLKKSMYYNILAISLIIFIEFPILYISYREAAMPYLVLGVYASIILFSKKTKYFVCASLVLTYIITVAVSFFYDDIYLDFKDADSSNITFYASLIVSAIVSVTTIIVSLSATRNNYDKIFNEYKEMASKLERVNHYDSLAPCYNRKFAINYIENLSKSLSFSGASLVLCDLLDTNNVNEKYGIQTGDDLIINFAQIAFKILKGRGFIARFNGVKFLLVLNNVTIESEIEKIYNDIISEFNAYYSKNRDDKFRIAHGISILKNNFNTDDEIMILTLSCQANSRKL
ncbi:MAG: GGDEF domain-containing protein [Acholeplasmatales bacterium]|nr:GGDEF domain-containing protein [Acholeplasmatales bacterium]